MKFSFYYSPTHASVTIRRNFNFFFQDPYYWGIRNSLRHVPISIRGKKTSEKENKKWKCRNGKKKLKLNLRMKGRAESNSHMERQVDEKMFSVFFPFLSRAWGALHHQNPGLLPIHTSFSTPQRALTSAYGVSPHRLPGKSQKGDGPFRKRQLEANVQGGITLVD